MFEIPTDFFLHASWNLYIILQSKSSNHKQPSAGSCNFLLLSCEIQSFITIEHVCRLWMKLSCRSMCPSVAMAAKPLVFIIIITCLLTFSVNYVLPNHHLTYLSGCCFSLFPIAPVFTGLSIWNVYQLAATIVSHKIMMEHVVKWRGAYSWRERIPRCRRKTCLCQVKSSPLTHLLGETSFINTIDLEAFKWWAVLWEPYGIPLSNSESGN